MFKVLNFIQWRLRKYPDPARSFSNIQRLQRAVCGALVLIASYNQDFLMREGLLRTVLVWIGERSFAGVGIAWADSAHRHPST